MRVSIHVDSSQWETAMRQGPEAIRQEIRHGVEDGVLYLEAQMTVYPPAPPRSTYRRTGTLGRSWFHRLSGAGNVTGEVVSSGGLAPYNVRVQDATHQAAIHRGRWQTIQLVMQRSEATVRQMLEARLNAALARFR